MSRLAGQTRAMNLLQKRVKLQEIVRLVGLTLSEKDRLTMNAGQEIREDYLQQNALMRSIPILPSASRPVDQQHLTFDQETSKALNWELTSEIMEEL